MKPLDELQTGRLHSGAPPKCYISRFAFPMPASHPGQEVCMPVSTNRLTLRTPGYSRTSSVSAHATIGAGSLSGGDFVRSKDGKYRDGASEVK